MPRDDFSDATKNNIAKRVGFLCSNPDCRCPTVGPHSIESRSISVGVAAHITAASTRGPRYDAGLTPEERRSDANGIWLCQKCARLIDVDDERWSVEIIGSWKMEAEDHALRIIGDPQKPIVSNFLHIPPPERFGYNSRVLVDEVPVLKASVENDPARFSPTWFVTGFVLKFRIQKLPAVNRVLLNRIQVDVHDWLEVPPYSFFGPPGLYPVRTSLHWADVDHIPHERSKKFTATRYYEALDGYKYSEMVARSLIVNDDAPSDILLRINAKTPGLYRLSVGFDIGCGSLREEMTVMPPTEVLFCDTDPIHGSW